MRKLYDGGGFEVTEGGVVKTPRASHDLSKLTSVSLHRRPFLLTLPLAVAVTTFVLAWWRYFSVEEIAWLLGLSAAAVGITSQIGVLRVDSVAITEPELATSYTWWSRAKAVRAAIEIAMDKNRAQGGGSRKAGKTIRSDRHGPHG